MQTHNASMFVSHFEVLRRTKALKENRDISLRRVAAESGLSLATIQRVKSGNMERLYLSTLDTLCRYFAVKSVSELIEYRPEGVAPGPSEVTYRHGATPGDVIREDKSS